MMLRMRLLSAGLMGLTLSAMTGCGLLHDLQPHRLQRLNRVEPMGSDAYQFSIPDPKPRGDKLPACPSRQ